MSGLFASSGLEGLPFTPTGDGGDLRVNTDRLVIRDGAQIAVNSLGSGDGGTLSIDAERISLDNRAQITAEAASGNGGNLEIRDADAIVLQRNSLISTTAGVGTGEGNGGNIDIDADFIVAPPSANSDIIANAVRGRGGNIRIAAQSLLGIQPRRAVPNNDSNDIDASSEFGLSGAVTLDQTFDERTQALIEIPITLIELSQVVDSRCSADSLRNEFSITGRGGLPLTPADLPTDERTLPDLGTVNLLTGSADAESRLRLPALPEIEQIVEAQGWYVDENDSVVLTATPSQTASGVAALPSGYCYGRFG
ncbi:MAG: S-layer family protein [Leptolyngbya sp. SIO4C1]|nr:S-layer family protein [Leptolyngbya sp. SIO4C1]